MAAAQGKQGHQRTQQQHVLVPARVWSSAMRHAADRRVAATLRIAMDRILEAQELVARVKRQAARAATEARAETEARLQVRQPRDARVRMWKAGRLCARGASAVPRLPPHSSA